MESVVQMSTPPVQAREWTALAALSPAHADFADYRTRRNCVLRCRHAIMGCFGVGASWRRHVGWHLQRTDVGAIIDYPHKNQGRADPSIELDHPRRLLGYSLPADG